MTGISKYAPKGPVARWLDQRLPLPRLIQDQFVDYPTPRNLNYWWTFGAVLTVLLVTQIASGIVLAMHYQPDVAHAFGSVERIMRDVNYGWFIRGMHATGASMFFIAVYIHMFRSIYYGSYKAPREVLWLVGCLTYVVMMATAFLGYVLPWGQMSFHGTVVITNLLGAIPGIGPAMTTWLWGGYAVDNPTLNRFYALHYLLPFVLAVLVLVHIWALHIVGQNNPAGIKLNPATDTVPFTPHATVKDAFGVTVFFVLYGVFVFYLPDALGHSENSIPANPLVTPTHIVPEWYFLPFYAILRAVPNKLAGVLLMFAAIGALFVLPWLDTSRVKSMRYRPHARRLFWLFMAGCMVLGLCGAFPPDDLVVRIGGGGLSWLWLSRISSVVYFGFFAALPVVGLLETPLAVPESISSPALKPQ